MKISKERALEAALKALNHLIYNRISEEIAGLSYLEVREAAKIVRDMKKESLESKMEGVVLLTLHDKYDEEIKGTVAIKQEDQEEIMDLWSDFNSTDAYGFTVDEFITWVFDEYGDQFDIHEVKIDFYQP